MPSWVSGFGFFFFLVFTSVQFFSPCLQATKSGGRIEVITTVLGQVQLRPNNKDISHYPLQDFIC